MRVIRLFKSRPRGKQSQTEMISRRKILSRSRDDLNSNFGIEEEDVWFQKDKLFKDHVQEVLNKWDQIDDEIWAKVICMERNRRVAKAYARTPVLTINGSDEGFDGYRIGLCGFDNPMRDSETEEVKRHIGNGVKFKMDGNGNIMMKRVSKCNVNVKELESGETSISSEVIKNNGQLEADKAVKLFDMRKFQNNISREISRAYPDRRKLERQCISVVALVKDCVELLECPCWVMMINIVAMDMLKSKLPLISKKQSAPNLTSGFDRPRLSVPEEDPYSVPHLGTSRSSSLLREPRDRPPMLPPRDSSQMSVPMPDYDDERQEENKRLQPVQSSSRNQKSGYNDDPYYSGFRARVPNYAKREQDSVRKAHSAGYLSLLRSQERTSYTSSLGSEELTSSEEEYSRIFRLRAPSHHHYPPREMYVGEWE
ncbi:uncharacterized protein LOC143235982 isoform X2 [Tachypleus tridentatus]|uniref:uncharacterized protein LOC143235982 isoform X2 n=1 Tax=Tachypleus tridentatus TaxID=6853 RepID=UPI003FD12AF2